MEKNKLYYTLVGIINRYSAFRDHFVDDTVDIDIGRMGDFIKVGVWFIGEDEENIDLEGDIIDADDEYFEIDDLNQKVIDAVLDIIVFEEQRIMSIVKGDSSEWAVQQLIYGGDDDD